MQSFATGNGSSQRKDRKWNNLPSLLGRKTFGRPGVLKREKVKAPAKSKVFDGKKFDLIDLARTRAEAVKFASVNRRRDVDIRIVRLPSPLPAGTVVKFPKGFSGGRITLDDPRRYALYMKVE